MRPHMHMQAHAHAHAHLPVCACARGRMPVAWRVRVRMHVRMYTCTPTRTHLQRDPPPRPALLPQVAAVTGRNLILMTPAVEPWPAAPVAPLATTGAHVPRSNLGPMHPGPGTLTARLLWRPGRPSPRRGPNAVAKALIDAPLLRHAPASAAAVTREAAAAPATSPCQRRPPPRL